MNSSSYSRARPTAEEVAQTKAEGREPGWLRSKLLGWQWPRPGVAPCGRPTCVVCGEVPIQCEEPHLELTEKKL